MVNLLFFLLLFVTPIIFLPFGISHYEIPKIFCAGLIIWLLVIIVLLKERRQKHLHGVLANYFPLILLIILTLADLLFLSQSISFTGNIFRYQGIFMLWNLVFLAIITSWYRFKIFNHWMVFAPLVALSVFAFFIGGINIDERALGTMGDPNSLASVALFFWPFGYFFSNKKIFKISSVLLGGLIVFVTISRSALIGFILQLILLVLVSKLKIKGYLAVAITTLLLLISFTLPFLASGATFESRVDIWKAAALAGTNSPLWGFGFGNTETALKGSIEALDTPLKYVYVDSSHNIFLDYWVQGGVIGLILILFLISYSLLTFLDTNRRLEIILMIGLIASLSFNPASVVTLVHLWWLIGRGLNSQTTQ